MLGDFLRCQIGILVVLLILPIVILNEGSAIPDSTYANNNLGISLDYPSNWKTLGDFDKDCVLLNNCMHAWTITTDGNEDDFNVMILSTRLNVSYLLKSPCNCDNLLDFVRWEYDDKRDHSNEFVINDNRTSVNQNHPAWQLEFIRVGEKGVVPDKILYVWALNNGIGYRFSYFEKNGTNYDNNLQDFKTMLNSIGFISPSKSQFLKEPSFLNPSN